MIAEINEFVNRMETTPIINAGTCPCSCSCTCIAYYQMFFMTWQNSITGTYFL